jgi:hypothetical protein
MKKGIIIIMFLFIAITSLSFAVEKKVSPCFQICNTKQKKCKASAGNQKEFKECKKIAAGCMNRCKKESSVKN